MATATRNLENDHVNILRLIDVMETMSALKAEDSSDIDAVIKLIKNYADGFHHAKEENLLFPMMVKKGYSTEQGPVAVMLHEHVLGRNYVQGMSRGLEQMKSGDINGRNIVYENMQGYIALLRNHIAKENNILFRMADNILTDVEQESLLNDFAKVENSNFCGGMLSDCLTAIDNLEKRYHK